MGLRYARYSRQPGSSVSTTGYPRRPSSASADDFPAPDRPVTRTLEIGAAVARSNRSRLTQRSRMSPARGRVGRAWKPAGVSIALDDANDLVANRSRTLESVHHASCDAVRVVDE